MVMKLEYKAISPQPCWFLAWAGEKSGNFTVKSAYRLAFQDLYWADQPSSRRAPDGNRRLWPTIWSYPAPPKVLIFACRLASYSLPTRSPKHSRHLEYDDLCPICDNESEDFFHALCRCIVARPYGNIWLSSGPFRMSLTLRTHAWVDASNHSGYARNSKHKICNASMEEMVPM